MAIIASCFALLLCATVTIGQNRRQNQILPPLQSVDANRDGRISPAEFANIDTSDTNADFTDKSLFRVSDGNHDGFLSAQEYRVLGRRLVASPEDSAAEIFKMADTNRNGVLTPVEAKSATLQTGLPIEVIDIIFSLADANRDGTLTLREFTGINHRLVEQQQNRGAGQQGRTIRNLLALMDRNEDRGVSLAELLNFATSHKGVQRRAVKRAFRAVDSDRNGRLEGGELLAMNNRLKSVLPSGVQIPNLPDELLPASGVLRG